MTNCCVIFSLKTGAIIASVVYFIFIAGEVYILFYYYHSLSEGVISLEFLKISFLIICCPLLFIGAVKEDRVCIIVFVAFNISCMMTEVFGIVISLGTNEINNRVPIWLITCMVVEHLFFIYMIPEGVLLSKEIKEKHTHLRDRISASEDLSTIVTTHVYGL